MKNWLVGISLAILAISCQSTRNLPEFCVERPVRPYLDAQELEVSLSAVMDYSAQLEAVVDSWEAFYNGLRSYEWN